MNIYDLKENYRCLVDAFDNAETEEEAGCVYAQILQVEEDMDSKADAYARIIRNKMAEADAIGKEIKNLTAKKERCISIAEMMKKTLLETMQVMHIQKIPTTIGTWSVRKGSPAVDVIDASKVSQEFLRYKEPEVNKSDILKLFKATGEIPDGVNIIVKDSLMFK